MRPDAWEHVCALVMIDEADVLLPRRETLAKYESVMAKLHRKMLETFSTWAGVFASPTQGARASNIDLGDEPQGLRR